MSGLDHHLKELRKLIEEYHAGSIVYHKASGKKCIVTGWMLTGGWEKLLQLDYGDDAGRVMDNDFCFSTTKPSEEDGDEWKDGLERS